MLESIVWRETEGLEPLEVSEGDLQRLFAVVAQTTRIASAQSRENALRRAQGVLPGDSPEKKKRYDSIVEVVRTIEAGTWSGDPLPKRAALWPLDASGRPLEQVPGKGAAPAWVHQSGKKTGTFHGAEGAAYGLFESDEPNANEFTFVSAYTGTTLSGTQNRPVRNTRLAWALGLVGGFGFILVALNISHLAVSYSQALDLLSGRQGASMKHFAATAVLSACGDGQAGALPCFTPPASEAEALNQRVEQLGDAGLRCVALFSGKSHETAYPKATAAEQACVSLFSQAVAYSGRHVVAPAENSLGRAIQTIRWWVLGWAVPSPDADSASLVWPMALMMAGVVALLAGLGIGVQGTALGVVISPENRYSLALTQVTLWTILVLTGVIAMAIFNGGLVGEKMRLFDYQLITSQSPEAVKNGFFPQVPEAIWALLGITFASPVLSNILKGFRPRQIEGSPTFEVAHRSDPKVSSGVRYLEFDSALAVREEPSQATVADLFLGEKVGNNDRIDISRLQMVMITAGLIITYGGAMFASVRDIAIADIVKTVDDVGVLFSVLPPVGTTMTLMLAASHAVYLTAKTADEKPA